MTILATLIEARHILHFELIQTQTIRSCLNCDFFNHEKEVCLIVDQRPPAKVLVYSCGKSWMPEIPF